MAKAKFDVEEIKEGKKRTYAIKIGPKVIARTATRNYALLLCWAISTEDLITDPRVFTFTKAVLDMLVATSSHLRSELK